MLAALVRTIAALASGRSQGDIIDFGEDGRTLKVQNLEHFDFAGYDIALFAAGSGPAAQYAPIAAAAGCVVIDNSSLFRMERDVPLIVPEVKGSQTTGITLLHVQLHDQLPAAVAKGVLQGYRGRYEQLTDWVTETESTFRDDLLADVSVLDLLTLPVSALAERWRQ